ncbi:outer membrane protein assembly factor BamB family protein [Catenulispora pinisilvae]|uniref:outer membrane protein assembly factor BamB family protein n=1 Tax=Catenulispora pinisilvae TaxID=2705253 RepID=UPI001890CC80|nr:PQQ-binding-like beta-propeller repeat protein [Catenulispora pinisilvae]
MADPDMAEQPPRLDGAPGPDHAPDSDDTPDWDDTPDLDDTPDPDDTPDWDDTPDSDGKRRRTVLDHIRSGVYVLLGIAMVVLFAHGLLALVEQSTYTPGTDGIAPAWSKPTLGAAVRGTWVYGDDLIVATPSAVTAYRAANGDQDWTWPVPAGKTICLMSQSASTPRGAVIYGTGQNCGNLQVIDLATGNQVWSGPVDLTDSKGFSPSIGTAGLSIKGSYVLAPYGDKDVVAIDVTTHRPVWNTEQNPPDYNCPSNRAVLVGTEAFYAARFCGRDNSTQIWRRDATSATPATAMSLPGACTDPDLLAVGSDLMVVCSGTGDDAALYLALPGSSSFIRLNVAKPDSWRIMTDAFPDSGQFTLTNIPFHGDTLYIPELTDQHQTDAITAVDLRNGKTLWSKPAGHKKVQGLPGATSTGALLGYLKDYDEYAITTMAASSGTQSSETSFDISTQELPNTYVLVAGYLIGVVDDPVSQGPQANNHQLVAYRLS